MFICIMEDENKIKLMWTIPQINDLFPRCNRGLTDEKQEAHGPHLSPEKTIQNQ